MSDIHTTHKVFFILHRRKKDNKRYVYSYRYTIFITKYIQCVFLVCKRVGWRHTKECIDYKEEKTNTCEKQQQQQKMLRNNCWVYFIANGKKVFRTFQQWNFNFFLMSSFRFSFFSFSV